MHGDGREVAVLPPPYGRQQLLAGEGGAGIRVAPHFYSTDDEVARVVGEIDDILATEAWKPFAGSRPTAT